MGAPFRRLWVASAVSNLADGVLKVALPLVAVRYTESPALVAGLTFALTLPWLLFTLPAGALADRLDRRLAMVGANVARAVLVAALAAVALVPDAGSIAVLYVVAFGVGVTETLYDTSAQSILPQVVPRTAPPGQRAPLRGGARRTSSWGRPWAGCSWRRAPPSRSVSPVRCGRSPQ